MKLISVICTIHVETGRANSAELYARLERFRPEVIFLEAPAEDLNSFFREMGRKKLEVTPVRKYQEVNGATLISVDLPTPPAKFFRDYDALVKQVENRSRDHRRLMTWQSNYFADYGFPYLNSEHNCKMCSEIEADFEATVAEMGDPKSSEALKAWKELNALREDEMVKNIGRHCVDLGFKKGVFIVGSAHRRAIIEKSRAVPGVQWKFSDI